MNVLNFDSKQCERVRRQLDAYLSNELLVETTDEVLKHLESCAACSREMESRMRVREALHHAVASQLPPEHLREAIHERLKRAQPGLLGGSRATTWTLALAAMALVVIAVAGGAQWLRLRHGRQLVASVLTLGVSDHVQCAIKGHNYPEVANPPDQLRQKLGPEYAALLPVVQEKLPDFQVLEAHLCHVPGSPREYVHFITRGHGTILSVILTKREGESLPAGRFLVAGAPGGVDLYKAHLGGMDVAGFESTGYFGFVVSDLGQNQVLQIAATLGPALRSALDETAGLRRCEIIAKEIPTQRPQRHGENAKRLEINDISCNLLTLSLCLCASVFNSFTASEESEGRAPLLSSTFLRAARVSRIADIPAYPYIAFNDLPKLRALQKQFPDLYRRQMREGAEWSDEAGA